MAGILEVNNEDFSSPRKVKIDMTYEILGPIISKVLAMEKTILDSQFKDEYLKNRDYWTSTLDSKIQLIADGLKSEIE
jgi:hypothetical protein